jgi:outer membrane receptor protein involved in Fe transport
MQISQLLLTLLAISLISAIPGASAAQDASDSTPTDAEGQLSDDIYIDDKKIEVIKVRGGESEGAADFESGDSVAAFDASDLDALGAQSIADLASFTPNLEIVTAGATTPTFFIRGVGLNDFNANSSGAVAIYFNDVPKNSPALQLGTLFDVEGVNVLRGPQGSGNYRSASAGAIKIYSKKPTGTYNAFLRQSYGNFNAVDLEGAVGGPIYEDFLAARIAFRFSDRDGYAKNGCGNAEPVATRGVRPATGSSSPTDPPWSLCGEDVKALGTSNIDGTGFADGKSLVPEGLPTKINDRHNWAARGTLLFQPTLDQEWLLTLAGGNRDEQTGQGQSHGTNKENESPIGTFGSSGRGVLGAGDGTSYIPREVEQARWKLNPCLSNSTGENNGSCSSDKGKYTNFASRSVLARDLARNLDDKPFDGDYNNPGRTELETWGVSLKGDIVVADSIHISTVTGYDSYDRFIGNDLDQSPNQNFEFDTTDDGWQFAQTIELEGSVSEAVPVDWRVGGLFLYEELNVEVIPYFAGIADVIGVSKRDYKQKLWSGGAYAEFTFNFWEKFAIDAGLRYNWERKSMDYNLERANTADFPLFARDTWQAPTGQIRMTYNFKENTYAYWKYTRGWKGGHYNATGGSEGVFPADPENIDSFEMGMHGAWLSGLLSLDVSFFHYNYEDYQLFTALQTFDGLPEFVVLNASDAEVYGSEVDVTIRPNPGGMLQVRFAWLQSQFLDYTQVQVVRQSFGQGNQVIVNNQIQATGNPLLNSPKFKISLTAQQTVPLGRLGNLTARWDGAWTADTTYDATNSRGIPNFEGNQFLPKHTIGQRAFWIHNLRLGYLTPNGGVEIAGWVRNVEDKVYKSFAFDASSFNGTTIFAVSVPRTYGGSVTTTF